MPKITSPLQSEQLINETTMALLLYPTRAEQARVLGIKERALRSRIEKYNIRSRVADINKERQEYINNKLTEMLPKVAEKLSAMLESEDSKIALEASKEIMKRTLGNDSTLIINNQVDLKGLIKIG